MWKSKKFILVALLIALVLVGSTAGMVLARSSGSGDRMGTTAIAQTADNVSGKTLMARVATILGIDQKKLESAFTQAEREMQNEALDNYLKNLVAQGKITQQQADQYKSWWQSRPDVLAGRGFPGHPGMPGPRGWGKMHPSFTPKSPTP